MGTAPKTASVRTLPQVLPRVHEEDRTAAAVIGSHAGSLCSAHATRLPDLQITAQLTNKSAEQIIARLSLK